MNNIKIRQITTSESDLKGMANVHRNCEDAWTEIKQCTAWITKRLDRGFYIQAAEADGKIVGHAEWIISDEPDRKFVYLGMMQIDEEYQRKGIGRLMIDDGIEYAKKNDCNLIVTSPDVADGATADIFYRKCGFVDGRKSYSSYIRTEPYKEYQFEKTNIDKVPFATIKEQRFIFGLGQFSSRHMWEVYNEKPSTDKRISPIILLSDGTYIQIDCTYGGYVLIWSNSEDYAHIIKSALAFGYSLGLNQLDFVYFETDKKLLDGFDIAGQKEEGFEQILFLK
jgi:GNAT superfamily N-acetyltransferase